MAICAELKRATPTVPVGTIEELLKIFEDSVVYTVIDEVRRNLELADNAEKAGLSDKAKEYKKEANRQKSTLPGIIFQASHFVEHEWIDSKNVNHGMGAWRHQEHVVMNGLYIVDIDHVDDPRALWKELKEKGVMAFNPFFVFVSPSGKGLKLVLPCDIHVGNIAANQKAFGEHFGVAVDEKCKDASRLTFVSKYDDILYSDNAVCNYENPEYVEKWNGRYSDGSADGNLFSADTPKPADSPDNQPAVDTGAFLGNMLRRMSGATGEFPVMEEYENLKYRGIAVSDLINEYFGGEPPTEGDRHDSMMRFVRDVRHILDNKDKAVIYWTLKLPFVQDLWKEGDNIGRDISDSLSYKYTPYMPQAFKKAIKKLKTEVLQESTENLSEELINQRYNEFGEQFKNMLY